MLIERLLLAGAEAIKDKEWIKKAIKHNTLWAEKIFSILKENKITIKQAICKFFFNEF